MKSETKDTWIPLLADMHMNGIRFDEKQTGVLQLHNQVKSAEAIQGRKI